MAACTPSDLLGAQVRLQGCRLPLVGATHNYSMELVVAGRRDPCEGMGWVYSGRRDPGHYGGHVAARAQWQPALVTAGILQLGLIMCDCRSCAYMQQNGQTPMQCTPSAKYYWIKLNESHDVFPMLNRHAAWALP